MRSPHRAAVPTYLILLALLLVAGPGLRPARANEDAWKDARKAAKALMDTPGEALAKRKAAEDVAACDTAEAADLLVDWYVRSAAWEEKELGPAHAEAHERMEKFEAMLIKSIGDRPPNTDQAKARNTVRKAEQEARALVDAEVATRRVVTDLVKRMGAAAADWFANEGLPALRRKDKDYTVDLRVAMARAMVAQPLEHLLGAILATAGPAGTPQEQAVVFAALARQKSDEGFPLIVAGLKSQHVLVRRAAVHALREYDQPRAVEPLIEALAKVKAFEAQEIEEILHWYTGQSFNGVARIWKQWWGTEGEAWAAKADAGRHPPVQREQGGTGTRATFYDIPTQSQAIVFVLDRSGSMKEPAGEKSRAQDDKPKGPVTGGGPGDGKGEADKAVAGDTRLDVAKNKLAQCVGNLAKDVRFGLVFYGSDVVVWKEAPALEIADTGNKAEALAWFEDLEPAGATALFDALMKALEYADGDPSAKGRKRNLAGGANTIFLLSDGSPTDGNGQQLTSEAFEESMARFLEANEIYRCVVHTIGIGPSHNRTLMQRIAAATGGEYRAAGVE